ncbi:MAG: hypothetical protein AAB874_02195, partial [Patescibacteria group bacterium]
EDAQTALKMICPALDRQTARVLHNGDIRDQHIKELGLLTRAGTDVIKVMPITWGLIEKRIISSFSSFGADHVQFLLSGYAKQALHMPYLMKDSRMYEIARARMERNIPYSSLLPGEIIAQKALGIDVGRILEDKRVTNKMKMDIVKRIRGNYSYTSARDKAQEFAAAGFAIGDVFASPEIINAVIERVIRQLDLSVDSFSLEMKRLQEEINFPVADLVKFQEFRTLFESKLTKHVGGLISSNSLESGLIKLEKWGITPEYLIQLPQLQRAMGARLLELRETGFTKEVYKDLLLELRKHKFNPLQMMKLAYQTRTSPQPDSITSSI